MSWYPAIMIPHWGNEIHSETVWLEICIQIIMNCPLKIEMIRVLELIQKIRWTCQVLNYCYFQIKSIIAGVNSIDLVYNETLSTIRNSCNNFDWCNNSTSLRLQIKKYLYIYASSASAQNLSHFWNRSTDNAFWSMVCMAPHDKPWIWCFWWVSGRMHWIQCKNNLFFTSEKNEIWSCRKTSLNSTQLVKDELIFDTSTWNILVAWGMNA